MPKKSLQQPLLLGKETIGQRIARLRKGRGLTQAELAEKIGISTSVITDYERGKAHLYDELIARFAVALGVSSDEILGLKNASSHGKLAPSLRVMRRAKEIENLPESRKKSILRTIDDLIRANS
jgi:transcriptional regulator with XRE-family HTH domain